MTDAKILLVEDNEKNMKLFRDVLRAVGYETLEATTGGQALKLAVEHDRAARYARRTPRPRSLCSH